MGTDYAKKCEGFPIGADSFACGLAIHDGKPILTTDVRHEPLWEQWLWITENFDFRACGSFPLRTSEGKVLGTFAVYWREPHEATPEDVDFANTIADTASIIVARHNEAEERKRAEAALQRAKEDLEARVVERTAELAAANSVLRAETAARADLVRRLASSQEDERRRVARDLHDSVGQLLAGLSLAVQAVRTAGPMPPASAKKLADVQRVADELGRQVHGLAVRLRPTALAPSAISAVVTHPDWSSAQRPDSRRG
jgi:signal transduction histidine kinase